MFLFGVFSAVVAYFALRKNGGFGKHFVVYFLLLVAVGLLHFTLWSSYPENAKLSTEVAALGAISGLSAFLGPLAGMLLAWIDRTQKRIGKIIVGVILILLVAVQVAALRETFMTESRLTNRWARQEIQQRNALPKFDLQACIVLLSLFALYFGIRHSRSRVN